MKLSRRGKLICNLVVLLLCLICLWFLLGKPLPLRWQYRLAEKAWFLEPKEIVCIWDEDTLFSRDSRSLYFYRNGVIRREALEDGRAFFMAKSGEGDIFCFAYDETGQAKRVQVAYAIESEFYMPMYYEEWAQANGSVACVILSRQAAASQENKELWRAEVQHFYDVIEDQYEGNGIFSQYELTVTWFAEDGTVLAEHKRS